MNSHPMTEHQRGQVITFYSFKGGVGRSMAVANTATLLAQRGKKVLVLDFDFEAPGLHQYFWNKDSDRATPPGERQKGVIDLFHEIREWLHTSWPADRKQRSPGHLVQFSERVGSLVSDSLYISQIKLKDPNRRNASATLDFISAGQMDETYATRVQDFDWRRFYRDYAEIFPTLANTLAGSYDYVLIDSRTGVTDIGSICTMMLPEKLVLVFSANEQSLRGALEVGRQAVQQRIHSADLRPLPLFPLLSRLENSEEVLKRTWTNRARSDFEALFREIYGLDSCDLETYFNLVRIPHKSYFAFGEQIAAETQPSNETDSLANALWQFVECLKCDSAEDAREVENRHDEQFMSKFMAALNDEAKLAELISEHPEVPVLRLSYAELLKNKGRFAEAIVVCSDLMRQLSFIQTNEAEESVARAALQKGSCLLELARPDEALAIWNNAVEKIDRLKNAGLESLTATILSSKSRALILLGRQNEGLASYDEVINRFGTATEASLREAVARTLSNKGFTLGKLEQHEEALVAFDEVCKRFGEATEGSLREEVARALANKSVALGILQRPQEALAAYDEVLNRFGEAPEVPLREQAARALFNKGLTLGNLQRSQEALAAYDELLSRFGNAPEVPLREWVVMALVNKGLTLGNLQRSQEALAAYDEVLSRFGNASEVPLREQVAMALVNKGVTLRNLQRSQEALAAYDEVLSRFGNASEVTLREAVAIALVNKGSTLRSLERPQEALAACDEVLSRFGNAPEVPLRTEVARALVNKGFTLGNLKRPQEGLAAFDEVLSRFGNAPEIPLREQVALALVNKGFTLGNLQRSQEALAAYDEVLSRFGNAPEVPLRKQVALTLRSKGVALRDLQRSQEALAAYDEVLSRFGDANEPELRTHVANALNSKSLHLLCEAKSTWFTGNEPGPRALLLRAQTAIRDALDRQPENPMALGNAGYIAFLLDDRDEARALLSKAFQFGGEELREAELKDSEIQPLPQDEEFRALVRSL